jgi:hypothetical protein
VQGGGALFINEIRKGNSLKLDGTWRDNHHYFQHGLGGAACIEYVEGMPQGYGYCTRILAAMLRSLFSFCFLVVVLAA